MWTCSVCTLDNVLALARCEVCDVVKGVASIPPDVGAAQSREASLPHLLADEELARQLEREVVNTRVTRKRRPAP